MRIVGGRFRGRALYAPKGSHVRPTSDRTREAVFNILEHGLEEFTVRGVRVVDAFAGTGALGLEALSRGAVHATFIESGRDALHVLSENGHTLGVGGDITIIHGDATRPPPPARACALAFLDPPYHKGLAPPCLTALAAGGWLEPAAACVIEAGRDEDISLPAGFEVEEERIYGAAKVLFVRYGI